MDPDANLKEQRELAAKIIATWDGAETDDAIDPHDAVRLAELVEALDRWLTMGGALPTRWRFADTSESFTPGV